MPFAFPQSIPEVIFKTSLPYRGKILSLSGTLRKTLQLDGKPLAPELSFLDGKLLADSRYLSVEDRFSAKDRLFEPAKRCFIVAHRSSIDKDGRLIFSLLRLKGGNRAIEAWHANLSDLFFDTNKARETDAFKIVFSKGNPSFDFKFLDMMDNKLVLIYMLHVHCLDLETGRILWKHRL
jgi:hypothetical protein